MALELSSLSDLTQADYNAALQLIRELLIEAYPSMRVVGGALDELLVSPASILEAFNQANMDRIRQANSLLAITEDPTLADSASENIVDLLASNYRISRLPAVAATGQATIVLTALVSTVIATDTLFIDPAGNVFQPNGAFVGRTNSGDVVTTTDRLIQPVGDGTFSFVIDITAVATGPQANDPRGTLFTLSVEPINFQRSFATVDLTGGQAEETNTALITRLRASWTNRTPATRTGLEGLFESQPGFEGIIAVSTIGFGDAEQQRNHSILPIAMPGRVDTYVRTQGPWEAILTTETALLIGTSGPHGIWQISMGRDSAPIYQIDKVTLPQDGTNPIAASFTITSKTPGFDISPGSTPGTTFLPDIATATEAAYSRYQTLTFTFIDTLTPLTGLVVGVSTAPYAVAYRSLPGIATLQDVVADRSVRSLVGDCLVKAPIPCFVTATVNVNHNIGADAVDTDAVAAAVAEAINATGFIGQLQATVLVTAAQNALPTGSIITSVSMTGALVKPNGTVVTLSSSSFLDVGSDPTLMTTSRTACYFSAAAGITVDVNDVAPPES